MKIELVKSNINPVDLSVGSARTCYSVELKTPESISKWDKKTSLLKDLFISGHHTTLQHATFTFLISGVSRLSIWRFFHSHRFYNSDQVSQRYTRVQKNSFIYLNETTEQYNSQLMNNYERLVELLIPLYMNSKNKTEVKNAEKKAMENARYILPQSIKANLYHTINLSTLIRYYIISRESSNHDAGEEIRVIVDQMLLAVLSEYPELKSLFDIKYNPNIKNIYSNRMLDFYKKNKTCELIDHSNFEDIEYSFFEGDTAGLSALVNSELGTVNLKFNLKLSLSADAQNQRHRTAYGLRPKLNTLIKKEYYKNTENYYIPDIFNKSEEAMNIFKDSINMSIDFIEKERKDFVKPYLLLNAFEIPIIEVNSGLDLIHKMGKRLCLNAQEEIIKLSWCMLAEIRNNKKLSKFADLLAPPCVHRFNKKITPICPEGPRFCGVKEWKNKVYY